MLYTRPRLLNFPAKKGFGIVGILKKPGGTRHPARDAAGLAMQASEKTGYRPFASVIFLNTHYFPRSIMFEVYSKYGKLMDRFADERTARQRLAEWPLAWTLVKDGKVVDIKISHESRTP